MTLWHKPTEKPRSNYKDLIVQSDSKTFFLLYGYGYPYGLKIKKWCYLSDLLKLERENKRLKKENEKLKKI